MRFAVPLMLALCSSPALAAPNVEQAGTRTAQALNGVLRNCPASFAGIGTTDKKCVGVSGTVEAVRVRLGEAVGDDLYGVWRSRDEQRSVYNWLRTPGGYVYIRLQPDPDGRAQTLVYLDTPPGSTPATPAARTPTPTPVPNVTVTRPTPAPAPTTPARPAPQARTQPATPTATTPAPSSRDLSSVPFRRTLQLQAQRLSGTDVEALQNRLIALTRPSGGGRGDGWYGPITAATVRAFQAANGLPVTGRVDRATWDALFSENARTFAASTIR
ncbi:peptidoglycan-binding domain-containing protein [Deinococcus sp. YIM 134068]|uniref:peptidoglycan-binding domain-containing protein n=1 Tax=Deinococcus lichenicola TaxID=3118910 RepID=UPI002F9466EB